MDTNTNKSGLRKFNNIDGGENLSNIPVAKEKKLGISEDANKNNKGQKKPAPKIADLVNTENLDKLKSEKPNENAKDGDNNIYNHRASVTKVELQEQIKKMQKGDAKILDDDDVFEESVEDKEKKNDANSVHIDIAAQNDNKNDNNSVAVALEQQNQQNIVDSLKIKLEEVVNDGISEQNATLSNSNKIVMQNDKDKTEETEEKERENQQNDVLLNQILPTSANNEQLFENRRINNVQQSGNVNDNKEEIDGAKIGSQILHKDDLIENHDEVNEPNAKADNSSNVNNDSKNEIKEKKPKKSNSVLRFFSCGVLGKKVHNKK